MEPDPALDEILPEWYLRPILIMGCGNMLFGDDGFGPAVVKALREAADVPEDVYLEDVGIGAREILFPMVLGQTKVRHIIIIDAVDFSDRGRTPGEVFEVPLEEIPLVKMDDFSMHQVPSSNLLKELRDQRNIKVTVLACQISGIPGEVAPGLSEPVKVAIPAMCGLVRKHWG
jgi:coenzyme F420 hydrogenase subunit delta